MTQAQSNRIQYIIATLLLICLIAIAATGCSTSSALNAAERALQAAQRIETERAAEAERAAEEARQAEAARVAAEAARTAALLAIPARNWHTKPEWHQCIGAPSVLFPGAEYRIWWNGPKPGGSWRFAYRGGGLGLYKRYEYHEDGERAGASDMWAVPGIKAVSVGKAGEQNDAGEWVRWFRWPRGVGPHAGRDIDGSMPATEHGDHYVGAAIKLRSAKATRAGAWFVVHDGAGVEIARKRIYDPEVRQE